MMKDIIKAINMLATGLMVIEKDMARCIITAQEAIKEIGPVATMMVKALVIMPTILIKELFGKTMSL